MKNNKYLPLGTIRFALAALVLISHARLLKRIGQDTFFDYGQLGVSLFFFISGFIIFSAYFSFYLNKEIRFLKNRLLKIYPSLWLFLILSISLAYIFDFYYQEKSLDNYGRFESVMSFIAIFGNINGNIWAPLGHAWSIHVELKFYMVSFTLQLHKKELKEV